MIIVVGKNSLVGPIIATVALSFIQYLALMIPDISEGAKTLLQSVETDFYAVAVILLILFAPKGLGALLGTKSRKARSSTLRKIPGLRRLSLRSSSTPGLRPSAQDDRDEQ